MTEKNIFISDEKLMKIPVKDNCEPLVNLKDFDKKIIIKIENTSKKIQKLPDDTCFVRKSVGLKLSKSQFLLTKLFFGFKFKIVDAYRPMKAQKIIYSRMFKEIKKKNSQWSYEKVEEETDKWVANPRIIPFHTTGGALDLTIVDDEDRELDMGTPINSIETNSKTDSQNISKKAKENRELLKKIMEREGFVNYPLEWWHWSYGDRYWAGVNKTNSIYSAI